MEQVQIIEELNSLILEGKEKILPTSVHYTGPYGSTTTVDADVYTGWHTKAISFLKLILPENSEFLSKFAELQKIQ